MNAIFSATPEHSKDNLRRNLHRVTAKMAQVTLGIDLVRDEVTIKEAAYLIGYKFWKNNLEKRAMLDGIMHTRKLTRK